MPIPESPRRPGDAEAPKVVQTVGAGRSVQRRPMVRTRPQPGRTWASGSEPATVQVAACTGPSRSCLAVQAALRSATQGAARAASSGTGCDGGRAEHLPGTKYWGMLRPDGTKMTRRRRVRQRAEKSPRPQGTGIKDEGIICAIH
jgi:hypothetical protein